MHDVFGVTDRWWCSTWRPSVVVTACPARAPSGPAGSPYQRSDASATPSRTSTSCRSRSLPEPWSPRPPLHARHRPCSVGERNAWDGSRSATRSWSMSNARRTTAGRTPRGVASARDIVSADEDRLPLVQTAATLCVVDVDTPRLR